ncbi:50S ribosomal protein L11 [Candidatus Peregrinibacteria bacterium CG22_combo_CG10-13_8_21_14_all_44_10]|nr:MAG: 50S ribosomal protein L11 [Candidatus Peregrinibacteria bacterium CG2_30_44_17]PIP66627.1 MAG: 50S ribosomal protein L11 [Candidatus Peregrinibacteria bacterium CG22_combo_CG10-13_8_21_14_all_44_10]PIS03882.1 MAG: 50S ribosomal protein L11 [Candidatus Peregrinibacteria bacterium CG10_big_fil_rev_8_21_14_0_10_44_7]PIX79946.1 MAG: 50S ribosomal protein L11 [Candidatus Peregrinibacteria bacterium CG_4_10_14_3_um_filter_44_21]PJB88308.1 MAG: 50S ribosomal protein L11 [Candidatus Peregriniba
MAKKVIKVIKVIKLQIAAGKANPAPPVGPALGQHGLQIQDFCNQFNNATKEMGDTVVPVEISVHEDRTFSFIMKTPPAAILIKKAIALQKGSGEPNKNKVGTITQAQLEEIATIKKDDLNANDVKAGAKIIAGTARSMGVEVKG